MSPVIIIHKNTLDTNTSSQLELGTNGPEGITQFLEFGNMQWKLKIDVLSLSRIDLKCQSMPNDSMILNLSEAISHLSSLEITVSQILSFQTFLQPNIAICSCNIE